MRTGEDDLRLAPNIGIKQGAPESAEIFGLLIDCKLVDREILRWFGRRQYMFY